LGSAPRLLVFGLAFLSILISARGTVAAEIIVLCPRAVEPPLRAIAHEMSRERGVDVRFVLGTAGALAKRAADGERADVIIGTTARLAELERGGIVAPSTTAAIGDVGVGVAVRAGATAPDIATPEALTRTLLAAASLGYADPARGGTGGTHFARVLERLGIADAVRAKTRLFPQGVQALDALARGEIELAVTPISEIRAHDGIALVGGLPGDLQSRLSYAAAVLSSAAAPAAARTFVARLVSADARARFSAAGFDPPAR
jgi:molybdate transport system substrate-binding protein